MAGEEFIETTLGEFRKRLDGIDQRLIEAMVPLLDERAVVVDMIAGFKDQHGIDTLQSAREDDVLRTRGQWAEDANGNRMEIQGIWRAIMAFSRFRQNEQRGIQSPQV